MAVTAIASLDPEPLLEASGGGAELRTRVEAVLERAAALVGGLEPASARGAALLRALHRDMLGVYDEQASTLADVVQRRRFNCVSATALFVLAADRVGLPAQVELLPTHARARVRVGERWQVVETTSPHGFDAGAAPPARLREGATLVGAEGVVGDAELIVAAMWVNKAALARDRGALRESERCLARAVALAPSSEATRMLEAQRAALLLRLALEAEAAGRSERAHQLLVRGLDLAKAETPLREALLENLLVLTQHRVRSALEVEGGETKLAALLAGARRRLDADRRVRLRAFLFMERARRLALDGDAKASFHQLGEAVRLPLSAHPELAQQLEQQRRQLAPAAADAYAREGALEQAEAVLAVGMDLDSPSGLRERLRLARIVGQLYLLDGRLDDAVAVLRQGLARVPEDGAGRHDLAVALYRQALPRAEQGSCSELDRVVRELEGLGERLMATELGLHCQLRLAEVAWGEGRLDAAEAALEEAARVAPRDPRWKPPLVELLQGRLSQALAEQQCARARSLAGRLSSLERTYVDIGSCAK